MPVQQWMERDVASKSGVGHAVVDVDGKHNGLGPPQLVESQLEEHGAHNVEENVFDSLRLSILRGCVGN